jgi:hypothetical protein
MEPYRVGALADLISSSSKADSSPKIKKKKSLGDLFASRLPPQDEIPAVVTPEKKSPKKRKAEKLVDKKSVDENAEPDETTSSKKKKKKKNKVSEELSDDDEDPAQYTKPSLRYQVWKSDISRVLKS